MKILQHATVLCFHRQCDVLEFRCTEGPWGIFFTERPISWCINVMPASSPMVIIFNGLHYFAKNDPHACGSCGPSCYTFTRTTCFDDDDDSGGDYYNHYYYGDKVNYYKNLTAITSQTQSTRQNKLKHIILFSSKSSSNLSCDFPNHGSHEKCHSVALTALFTGLRNWSGDLCHKCGYFHQ